MKMEESKILQGDCLEIMKTMSEESIDLAFFDPPFKLSQSYSTSVDADNLLDVASIVQCSIELKRIVKKGKFACVIYDNRILPLVLKAFRDNGWKYLRFITLYRKTGSAFCMHGWMSTSDVILLFQNGEGKEKYFGKCHHDVYTKSKMEIEGFGHPAQKPLDICMDIVQRLSQEGDIVLDPYCGSGTIPVACKILGRVGIGIDSSKEYCQIARERLSATPRTLPNGNPNGEFNKDLEATPKSASQTSLNPSIRRNLKKCYK